MGKDGERLSVDVLGREVQLTHLDKVLFPATGFTKGHLINYYARIAPYVLPHLKQRPLTLKMYQQGLRGAAQYIKNAPSFTPKWIKTFAVPRRERAGEIRYLLINDLPSLMWACNMNNIELHVFQAKAPKIQQPTMMVFDLDPGEPAGIRESAQVALMLKETLESLGLQSLLKTSGGKGLHVCVPLNTPVTYEQTGPFAESLAQWLERAQPDLIVSRMAKSERKGKVFIDWSQNSDFKTTVCVYSLRAKGESPTVSFPLDWKRIDDVEHRVTPDEAIKMLTDHGDLFESLLTLKQKLPKRSLAELLEAKPTARLKEYWAKRDFTRTAEPSGAKVAKKETQELMFVIQKHAASHLHYDFRLEMEGVLRSWAVPKGPPTTRGETRLAMHVEDHPMDYARFEGVIPKGQYGGGTVMVWDIGTYSAKEAHPVAAYHQGKIKMDLNGKKLKGEWTLVRDKRTEKDAKQRWLLIKTGTNTRPISKKVDDSSAITGRSMEQIAHEQSATWQSDR
ncbi:MAG TPA: non-homologous end-joining DNA ligase [Verrucomicrobiae bacterium]|nr:non-homologous end-joining DNA ligase [Verrucomicrobiae bacterium]